MGLQSLFEKGEYLEILNQTQNQIDVDMVFWRANALKSLDRYDEAIEHLNKFESVFSENLWKCRYLTLCAGIYLKKNNDDFTKKYIEEGIQLCNTEETKQEMATLLRYKGAVFSHTLDLDNATKYTEKAMKLSQEVNDRYGVSMCLNNLGFFSVQAMDLENALEYYNRAIEINQQMDNLKSVMFIKANLVNVYFIKGDIQTSLNYQYEVLHYYESENNLIALIENYYMLGYIHMMIGQIEKAIEWFQLGLKIDYEDQLYLFTFNFSLVYSYLLLGDRHQAEKYLKELDNKVKPDSLSILLRYQQIAHALFNKSSTRITDKAKAQESLKEVLKQDPIDFNAYWISTLHLIELLIQEFKFNADNEVLLEINDHLGRLYDKAQDSQLMGILIECLLLKSKLSVVQGKYDDGDKLVEQALMIATENKITGKVDLINSERKKIRGSIQEIQLTADNTTISERMDRSEILDYLRRAQQSLTQLNQKFGE